MGTNYYLHRNVCEECGHASETKHIGKSSAGWCFALHVEPDNGINDLQDWIQLWSQPESFIRDEYGKDIPTGEMYSIITIRSWPRKEPWSGKGFDGNYAERGPNGLIRHIVDQPEGGNERKSFTGGCIKHGSGTWDCLVGEFS